MKRLTFRDLNAAFQYNIDYSNTIRLNGPSELPDFCRKAYAKILDLQKIIQAKLPNLKQERK